MVNIQFSKEYNKLHGQITAELLAVRRIKIDETTPPELLEYDTTATDGTRYELENGNYLQLIFLGNLGIPFCTIRKDNPAINGQKTKFEYYSDLIGKVFEIMRN